MKRFILLCFAFSVITACSKKDIDKWTKRSCDVAEQNDVYSNGKDEISRRNFKKTYNANGLAKTLVASTSYAEGGFDSLVCSIDYQKNAATIHVTSIKEPFQGGNIEINSYNLAVTFDPVTGNATSVGSDVIAYENKKVQTFGDVTFSYDVQGNLISIYKNQGNPAAQLGERYTYDLNSKAGKQELYLPSTLAVG
ncbi:MAG TPA: hypothetical protein VK625_12230, partial [Flavitalea sp.]|nr:hypothetical protein [Flavitalea sp.]